MAVKAVAARKNVAFSSVKTTDQFLGKTLAAPVKPHRGYVYSGLDYNKKILKNVLIPYQTESEARLRLGEAGITITKIAKSSNAFAFLDYKKTWKPSVKDMANLADQLAAMKDTGANWDKITMILARVTPKEQVRAALHSVSLAVSDATPPDVAFAAEMDKKGKPFFPSTFVYAFTIAEKIGAFPDPDTGVSSEATVVMLRFFARGQRKIAATIKKLISGLIGPTAIFVVATAVFFGEVYFIVPQFAEIFIGLLQGKDTSLPLPTQIMIDISNFLSSWLGISALGIAFGSLVGAIYYLTVPEKGVENRGRWLLKIPILKAFFLPFFSASFIRNMAIMTNDPDVTRQFEVLEQTTDNPAYKDLARHCRELLFNSSPTLPQVFQGHLHLLGDMFAPVIETVDANPAQAQVLLYNYSKQLEEEADDQLAILIAVLSNVVYIFAAVTVFFILIASYAPLITMIGRLAGGSK